jgi:hypothetical protein
MKARIALALAALVPVPALTGCAASHPVPAAPNPIVAYAIPVRDAPAWAPRSENLLYQARMASPTVRPPSAESR